MCLTPVMESQRNREVYKEQEWFLIKNFFVAKMAELLRAKKSSKHRIVI